MQLGQRYLIRFGTPPWGTQAYIVSREGAARLTQSIKSISRPVDDEFDRFWQHGLPSYALFPYPVMELESSTTIVKSKLDTTLLPARKRLLNYWSRGSEKARKECANLWLTFRDRDIERRLRCEPLSFLR
jgi:glycosyl transferase family 25